MVKQKNSNSASTDRLKKLVEQIVFEGSEDQGATLIEEEPKRNAIRGEIFIWWIWDVMVLILYLYDYYVLIKK